MTVEAAYREGAPHGFPFWAAWRDDVRQRAEESAPTVFQARKGVALEITELGAGPWVKVRHRDGQTGFVRANQVWGL